jgi:hypothetical protein
MNVSTCSGGSGCSPAGAAWSNAAASCGGAASAATKAGRAFSGLTIDVYASGTDQADRRCAAAGLPPVFADGDAHQRPPAHKALQRVLAVEARARPGRLPSPKPERPPLLRLPAQFAADSLAADSAQGSASCAFWEAVAPPGCLPPPLFGWQQGDGSLRMHPHIELLMQASSAPRPSPLSRASSGVLA